jgi:high-affinity nickel-transport protein
VRGIEALELLADRLKHEVNFWDFIGALNDNFGTIGYATIGIFATAWLISAIIYRLKRCDEIEIAVGRM